MNRKSLQIWIAALRSGKYKQTTRQLFNREKTEFCCLGVANEVLHCGIKSNSDSYYIIYDKLGIKRTDLKQYGSRLVAMNDAERKNFNEIADYIEEVMLPLAEESACGN